MFLKKKRKKFLPQSLLFLFYGKSKIAQEKKWDYELSTFSL